MKKLLFILAIVCAGVTTATAQELVTGPAISLDKDVHDYGLMQKGADGNCVFTVTNTGSEPLILSNCKGSCGCTVPQCDKAPIMPGSTSEIKVKYDTKRVGPINKSVTITSNAVNEATKIIRIKGKIEGAANAKGVGAPVKAPISGSPVNK